MAFSDIKKWADMINESAKAAADWDKACLRAEAQKQRREQEEYDNIAVDQVTPDMLGTKTKSECDGETLAQIAEKDDVINFTEYLKELDEADDREVLSHGLDIAGVKASTANLAAQDTVQLKLAEAIEKLSQALTKKDETEEEKPVEPATKAEAEVEPVDEAEKIQRLNDMMDEALEAADDDIGATGIPDAELEKLDKMSNADAVKFLTGKLEDAKTPEQKEAIMSILDTYDYDDSPISKTGFAPATKELVDTINYEKLDALLARANELVDKRDSEGLTDDETEALDRVIDQLKELENSDRTTYTVSSYDKAAGTPGEFYRGPVPGFNAEYTGHTLRNDAKRKSREELKAQQDWQKQHPNVPERGKEDWDLADDWNNKIMSNFFNPGEKKEFLTTLKDGADAQEKAAIDYLVKGKVDGRTLGAAWGVSHTAISKMETTLMNAMLNGFIRVGFMTSDQVHRFRAEDLEKQKKAFAQLLERFLSRASDAKVHQFKEYMKEWAKTCRRNTKFNPKKVDPVEAPEEDGEEQS